MAKQKKKRNKVYTGVDAAIHRPSVTRISAVNRNRVSQFWFDRKRVLKPVLITVGVVIVIIALLIELIRVVSGS